MAADDNGLMMAPAGWEGSPGRLAFLRNRALRDKEGDGGDGDEKKRGRMFGGVGIYSYLCGAFCSQKRLQRKQKGRPGMAADETQRRRPGMAATWIMKTNE